MTDSTEAAIGISWNANLGAEQGLVLQTHVPQSMSQKDLNALLDRMRQAARRQTLLHEIRAKTLDLEVKNALLDEAVAAMERARESLGERESLRRTFADRGGLTPQQKRDLQTLEAQIQGEMTARQEAENNRAKMTVLIARAEKELAERRAEFDLSGE